MNTQNSISLNPEKKMSKHVCTANVRKHMKLGQLRSTQQGNVKHVHSVNMQTHKTQSALDQLSKENIKHIPPANTQSALARKMPSTYLLWTCKHMELSQPQINPARKTSSMLWMHQHTELSQPQINPARKMSSMYGLWTHGTQSMVLFQYFYYPRLWLRFSELRFVFCHVVLSASLLYLLDGLPVVFSGLW